MKNISKATMAEFRAHLVAASRIMKEHGGLFTAAFSYQDEEGELNGGGSHNIEGSVLRDHAEHIKPEHRMMYLITAADTVAFENEGLRIDFDMKVNGKPSDGFVVDHYSLVLANHAEQLVGMLGHYPDELKSKIDDYSEALHEHGFDSDEPEVISARNRAMAYVVSQIAMIESSASAAVS